MCTAFIFNGKHTIVGFDFDNSGWQYKIDHDSKTFMVSLFANKEFWLPVFGGNNKGNFGCLPTLNPPAPKAVYPGEGNFYFIDRLNAKLIDGSLSFKELKSLVFHNPFYNEIGNSLQAQESDKDGNVLQIYPGLGFKYLEKPRYSVLTNFQLLVEEKEHHPWAGVDRYQKATQCLLNANDDFGVKDAFALLKDVTQNLPTCKTDVSIVFDVTSNEIYWCEKMNFDKIEKEAFKL
jgi:hypothetical protein